MGSMDKACISGFLCRLCSEMHRIVIHIYGDQGKRLGLIEKINGYLPITISPTDPLPKTICHSCLRRVEQHYDLLLRLSRVKEGRFLRIYKPSNTICSNAANAQEDEFLTEDEIRRNNPNGPFIIASTSLSAAANVSRSSPTTLSSRVHEIAQSTARNAVDDSEEDDLYDADADADADEDEDENDDDDYEEEEAEAEEDLDEGENYDDDDEDDEDEDVELELEEEEETADDAEEDHNYTEENIGIDNEALAIVANNFDASVVEYASIVFDDSTEEEHMEGDVIEDGIVDMEVLLDGL